MSRQMERELNKLPPDERARVLVRTQQLKKAYQERQLFHYLENLVLMELNTGNQAAFDLYLLQSGLVSAQEQDSDKTTPLDEDFFTDIAVKIETRFVGKKNHTTREPLQ